MSIGNGKRSFMYGCESWSIKKAEHWRIDAFELGVREDSWESLGLKGDQTSQSYRKSILNIHWKDWCWSWNSNILATWCEELTHWKRLKGKRRRGQQRMRWLDSITYSMDMNLSKLRDIVKDRWAWWAAVHGVAKSQDLTTEQQQQSIYMYNKCLGNAYSFLLWIHLLSLFWLSQKVVMPSRHC